MPLRTPETDPVGSPSTNTFLASLTFTNGQNLRKCDCDECGISVVPVAIAQAVTRYKRQKLESGPLKRTQHRSLIQRHGTISVYEWLIPVHAEPLIEFGNSHRLVWVKRLPKYSQIQSIGMGIIGSSTEEKGRLNEDWEEGSIYLVPSNGGKAVGWVHVDLQAGDNRLISDTETALRETNDVGPVLLRIAKVPTAAIDASHVEGNEEAHWSEKIRRICCHTVSNSSGVLSVKDTEALKEVIKSL